MAPSHPDLEAAFDTCCHLIRSVESVRDMADEEALEILDRCQTALLDLKRGLAWCHPGAVDAAKANQRLRVRLRGIEAELLSLPRLSDTRRHVLPTLWQLDRLRDDLHALLNASEARDLDVA